MDGHQTSGTTLSPYFSSTLASPVRLATLLSCLAVAALTACGGGGGDAASAEVSVESAPRVVVGAGASVEALPTFHMAPAQLEEPADVDMGGRNASAGAAPLHFRIDASVVGLSTARLTPDILALALRARALSAGATKPAAAAITAAVYTPAQIRAAYGLPPLPAAGATLSAAAAATFGAGQTVYLIDAYDHPNAFSDLAKFSAKFGLAACTSAPLTGSSTLPLPSAAPGCTFSVAYTDSTAALRSSAPAYNVGWIAEIALDVEWAHAIAPLARIVLIEVTDSGSNNLLGGVALANRMGAGVVSMSFGAPEGAWILSDDASFAATGMTYVAAAGDGGAQALWPAVSPHVLAVGGTSLQWSGAGTRYEAAWASSGGGVSAIEPLPTWQAGTLVAGAGNATMRTVSDVAFNANPTTGQYVALTAQGSTTTAWNAYGGTSIGAPQWAGLVAVANARRALASRALLGDFHTTLYKTIAASPGTYAAAFADVVSGSDGTCATCSAASGYDAVTGWGTPNATALLDVLATDSTGVAAVNHAPTLASGAITVKAGSAFTIALPGKDVDGDALTYTMTGAPNGLALSSAGVLSWVRAVRGTYALKVVVKDSHGLAGAVSSITLIVTA